MPNIYGYARASTLRQEKSCGKQEALFIEKAEAIDGEWVRCFPDEGKSGWTTEFVERMGARRLLAAIEPGDHVIVWKIDRLGRRMLDILSTIELLRGRQVKLHVLDLFGFECRADDPMAELLLHILAAFAQWDRAQIVGRMSEGAAYAKANEQAYNCHAVYGARRIHRRGSEKTTSKFDIWDEDECMLIREVYVRMSGGENAPSIARDFLQREARTARGRLWVKEPKPGKEIQTHRIRRVFAWYRQVRLLGIEIGPACSHTPIGLRNLLQEAEEVAV